VRNPLDLGRQDDGLLFSCSSSGGHVFAITLLFADSPKQPAGQSQWGAAGNKPSSDDHDHSSLSEIAADTGRAEPMPRTRKVAPIVDGPAQNNFSLNNGAARYEEGENVMTRFQGVRCGRCHQLIATGSANSGSPVPEAPIHCPCCGQRHSYREEDRVEFDTEDGLSLDPA
jgi:hypothetical protein